MKNHSQVDWTRNNLESCGFVCPACNFRLRLTDPAVAEAIVELFNRGMELTSLECTECGHEQQYSREDLQMFLPRGRQAPLRTRQSSRRTLRSE